MNDHMIQKPSILVHIVSGIAGIWSGTLIMLALWEITWLLSLSRYTECSGTPCSSVEIFTPIVTATIGGMLGGVIAYSIVQRLSHRPIRRRSFLISGAIGLVLWPVIGFLWFLLTILIAPPIRSDVNFVILSSIILTLLGIIIGISMTLIYDKVIKPG